MDKSSFQSIVREYIKEYSSPKETVKKSELRAVIKECLRAILNEVVDLQKKKKKVEETTTTDGGTPGYQIPGWVSRKGGSQRGVEGSRKLGYELTPAGEKEMQRQGDRLV